MKTPNFRPYDLDQLILPSDMREWLPENHLANFIIDVVADLDLSAIINTYDASRGGQPPLDPRLMVGLLLYGYCVGTTSSRKIERATYDSVPFRVIAADQHPDHDTIAEFRRRHLCRPGRVVRPGLAPVPGGRTGQAGPRGAGRHQNAGQRLQAQGDELRIHGEDASASCTNRSRSCWRRPRPPTPPRTRFTGAAGAATSCPKNWPSSSRA